MRNFGHRAAELAAVAALAGGLTASSPGRPAPRSSASAPAAAWVPGFWDLRGDPATAPRGGWEWVPGRWIQPPVSAARWVPGEWGWHDDWWSWIPGHWELR